MELKAEIESAGGKAEVIAADLGSENERLRLFEQVRDADVLVNNAGLGWYGYFNEMPWETVREMLQVNIGATAHLTSLFLPGMRKRNAGHIINVGSISGSIPSQGIAMYAASKSFMDAFTTALYRETRGTQVQVSVVRAGPVKTEFCESAFNRAGGGHVPTERMGVTANQVAWRIWKLLLHPRRVIYVPRLVTDRAVGGIKFRLAGGFDRAFAVEETAVLIRYQKGLAKKRKSFYFTQLLPRFSIDRDRAKYPPRCGLREQSIPPAQPPRKVNC